MAGGGSVVNGTAAAIERVQRSSAHFAQRPDRTYSPLDPTLTSLGGWTTQVNVDRVSGRHWLWGANTKIDSENFETNDLAILNGADGWLSNANLRYRETQPGRVLRNYQFQIDVNTDTTLRRLVQAGYLRGTATVTWANFWTSSIAVRRDLAQTSVSLTRGGPLMGRGAGMTTVINVGNRAGAQTRWSAALTSAATTTATPAIGSAARCRSARARGGSCRRSRTTTAPPSRSSTSSTLPGGRPETYGSRYVFAFIDRSTMATAFRLGLHA